MSPDLNASMASPHQVTVVGHGAAALVACPVSDAPRGDERSLPQRVLQGVVAIAFANESPTPSNQSPHSSPGKAFQEPETAGLRLSAKASNILALQRT
jgi:hypothetical protein